MLSIIEQTLERIQKAMKAPVIKTGTTQGITTNLGLVTYNLEPVAKLTYPVLTPLRNEIMRTTKQNTSNAVNWKAITGINTTNMRAGVSEGNRSGVISTSEQDYIQTYKGLGLENSVTFEADYAGRGFDDVKNVATLTLMQAVMIQEEAIILHGNTSLALGTPAQPAGAAAAGGALTNSTTWALFVVALTYDAYINLPATLVAASALTPLVTRTNADGTQDTFGGGTSIISAASAAITTSGGNNSIAGTVAAVKGAVAYAWFLSTDGTKANATLNSVTTVNAVTIAAASVPTYTANDANLLVDHSTNALIFDGLITQTLKGNGYFKSLDGAKLTADGNAGVTEIDTALKYFWDNFRITPSKVRVGSQVLHDLSAKVLSSSNNPVYRINMEGGKAQGTATAGTLVTSYLNKYGLNGAMELPVLLHPNMPPGMIFFDMDQIPYPTANIPGAREIELRQDYYQLEWPLVSRKWQYGVYLDGVLKVYVPFSMGIICNILAG